MQRNLARFPFLFTVVSRVLATALPARECSISALQRFAPAGTTILTAEHVPAGGSYGQGTADLSYPANGTSLPELCAAIVNVTSSPTSSFTFGLYLPFEWESRFMEVGNGAFAGGINWQDMATASRYKMASISTDCGHSSAPFDASWAFANPEARADWGWRAIHNSLVVGKLLTEKFYGSSVRFTYYMGASTGGRQGLKEIEKFPRSFDGAIIGPPGWWTNHLQPWMTKVGIDNTNTTVRGHIRVEQFGALAEEVVRQCDGVDGVEDGIVSAPEECEVDYAALLCGEEGSGRLNGTTCFTWEQVETLKEIYGDYYTEDGDFVFPGFMRSSEAQWSYLLGGSEPSPLGADWVKDFLLNNATWTWRDYNDSVVALADKLNPGDATVVDFDFTDFREAGGKIVMYHGLSDGAFSARSSQIFYENVARAMGYPIDNSQPGNLCPETANELQKWYKFFLVPGMEHCYLSAVNAPWYINGPNQAAGVSPDVFSVPGYEDPQHDVIMAMLNWVEKGEDFDVLIGTAYKDDKPGKEVLRQRPLCLFPMKQVYNGSGNPDLPRNWHCAYHGQPY